MRWPSAWLTVCSCALVLAGCGGGERAAPAPRPPRIPAEVATRLAAEADRVWSAAPGSCAARDAAARLRHDVIASIGRIPPRFQEPLTSAANALAARTSTCTPPRPQPQPQPQGDENQDHSGHGKHEEHGDHGKHEEHGKKKHGEDE